MLEHRKIAEKKFNKETHKIIGEVHLYHYGNFLEKYNNRLNDFKKILPGHYNNRVQPVSVECRSFEDATILQLVQSDNKFLSRILIGFVSICEEMRMLIKEANETFYVILMFYGEDENRGPKILIDISNIVELLQKIMFFVNRSHKVIILLLQQLCALVDIDLYAENTSTTFSEPLNCLSELLVCLLSLESLLSSAVLNEHWHIYLRTVQSMLHNPSQCEISLDKLRFLHKCLLEIDKKLLRGKILQHTMEKCVDEKLTVFMKSTRLVNEFTLWIQQMLNELEKDEENALFTRMWLQLNALFVFQHTLFGTIEKKMFRRLCEINKKIVCCVIVGNILWYPEKFLLKYIPSYAKTLDLKVLQRNRLTQMTAKSQNLLKESNTLCTQAVSWIIETVNITKHDMSHLRLKHLQDTGDLLIEGIRLLKKIGDIVQWIINLHADEGRPMAKSVILVLCKLVEILKAIQFTFHKNLLPLVYISMLVIQHLTHKALTLLLKTKKSITQDKSYKDQQLDVLSSLNVAEHVLKGASTSRRILVAKLALCASGLSHDNLAEIRCTINRLESICSTLSLFNQLCNSSFLYWHQVLLRVYFSKLVKSNTDISRIYLLCDALNDCSVIAGDEVNELVNGYLKHDLVGPVNQMIETNLRLQTHLHLHLPPSDPFQQPPAQTFRNLVPVRFSNKYIHIKQEVEHYLSTMFYNLTTVVLHDWKTYGEMRRLALLQYELNTVEDNLPMQTLEQGLDVLEIMRNINIFVGKYLYNLNNQVFIEEWSNNKHLNTINISHVANSIRTHGMGIMNTTVNFTYQFLQNKFYIFSQFMFDEQIKSRLLKDLRFFLDHKTELNQLYPYERAEKFNLEIRKLGLNQNGLSYLDLFRKLITHIGNAMGYVRLIRSGGRRCLADATCFIPDLKAVSEMNKLIEGDLTQLTKKSAQYLKRDIKSLVDSFEEATEYFRLLVKVFTAVFRNPENIHLKNFYVIVPPLTINFVKHSLTCKERLNKKNKAGTSFTDDGFAMGLAYVIELLDQSSQLNSLHWFQSVRYKHLQSRKKLESQKSAASRDDDKLQQTLSLTEKRLSSCEKEFQLLFYNFNSARIFFQS